MLCGLQPEQLELQARASTPKKSIENKVTLRASSRDFIGYHLKANIAYSSLSMILPQHLNLAHGIITLSAKAGYIFYTRGAY